MTYAALWASAWPIITAIVAGASVLDATLPQPAAGSHWLIPRKIISFIAANVGNASNGKQPDFATWVARIAAPILQGQGIVSKSADPAPVPPLPEPLPAPIASGPAASIVIAALVGMGMLAGLGACASSTLTADQLSARQAHRELIIATAAVDTAAKTAQTPGLSPAVVADIKAGAQAVAAGVSAQTAVARSGGSALSQAVGGMAGGLEAALPKLGAVLTAAHGTSAGAKEVAMAAGEGAFAQVPDIAVLIADDLDPTWVPSADMLKADAAGLASALADVEAVGSAPAIIPATAPKP